MSECRARYEGRPREAHKPCAGTYDEMPVVSCVWCGKLLAEHE